MRRTAQLKSSLADAGSDLSTALSIAPLSPRGHLTGCILSPLLEMPAKPWLESSATLVNNSSELLFLNGLLSFHCDETELAVDQWSKSLSLGHRYVGPIIELSRQKLPLMRVATELVPANRPAYYVRLLQLDQMDQSNAAADGQAELDRALIESLVDHIRRNELIQPGDKHATIARIWRLLGDVDAELHAWESALKAEARDPNYRLEYSQVLSQLGRNDEALEQAILGKTLNPSDGRFERLTSRIRQAMRRQTRR